jgi:hypothetical protein
LTVQLVHFVGLLICFNCCCSILQSGGSSMLILALNVLLVLALVTPPPPFTQLLSTRKSGATPAAANIVGSTRQDHTQDTGASSMLQQQNQIPDTLSVATGALVSSQQKRRRMLQPQMGCSMRKVERGAGTGAGEGADGAGADEDQFEGFVRSDTGADLHTHLPHTWSNGIGARFPVRALGYKQNKLKEQSGEQYYELVAFDLIHSLKRLDNIAERMKLPPMRDDPKGVNAGPLPRLFIVNIQIPFEMSMGFRPATDGVGCSMVFCFRVRPEAQRIARDLKTAPAGLRHLHKYFTQAPKQRSLQEEFKAMAFVENIEKLGLGGFIESYNGKPVLVKASGTLLGHEKKADPVPWRERWQQQQRFKHSPLKLAGMAGTFSDDESDGEHGSEAEPMLNAEEAAKDAGDKAWSPKSMMSGECYENEFLEMDVNTRMWGLLTRQAFHRLKERVTEMELRVGFVIQGGNDEELPENVFGCAEFHSMNLMAARSFDTLGSRAGASSPPAKESKKAR